MNRIVSDFDQFIKELRSFNGPLILYGAGMYGEPTYMCLFRAGKSPVAFCDRSPLKIGTEFCGLPVIPPERLKEYPGARVILSLSVNAFEEACRGLNSFTIDTIYAVEILHFQISNSKCQPDKLFIQRSCMPFQTTTTITDIRCRTFTMDIEEDAPPISIIMPTYNCINTVTRAISSVQAQSYPHWKLFVCDDGSIDNTPQIVHSLSESDRRIVLKELPHNGVSAARNVGLAHVKSKYVAFLDSDDWWNPLFLENVLAAIQDVELSVCGFQIQTDLTAERLEISEGNPYVSYKFTPVSPQQMVAYDYSQACNLIQALLTAQCFYPLFNKLYRMDRIHELNLWFDESIKSWGEDDLFNARYVSGIESLRVIEPVLATYTTDIPSALSYQYDPGRFTTEEKLLQAYCKFLPQDMLGEWLCGRLVHMLENDINAPENFSLCELTAIWEARLFKTILGETLRNTSLWGQWICYMQTVLAEQGYLLSIWLHNQAAKLDGPSALGDLLLSAACYLQGDPREPLFLSRAISNGAPPISIQLT